MTAIELLFAPVLLLAVPLALGRLATGEATLDSWLRRMSTAAWPATALLAAALFLAPSPLATLLATPWQALTGLLAISGLLLVTRSRDRARVGRALAVATTLGFVAFGAANATSFTAGFGPLGFGPVIILLTAVHFHAAGFVLMTAGLLAFDRRPSPVAAGGIAGVGVGSVITAAGFIGAPGAAVVGAVTVAIGGLLIGLAMLPLAGGFGTASARVLGRVGGAALFVSMPLAIAWAVGSQVGAPPLTLDVMVRTHGAINALFVTVPLMLAWTIDARSLLR